MPADATLAPDAEPVWTPGPARVARANLTRFLERVRGGAPGAEDVTDLSGLYRWSITRPEAFWPAVWEFCGVVAEERAGQAPWDRREDVPAAEVLMSSTLGRSVRADQLVQVQVERAELPAVVPGRDRFLRARIALE